MKTNQDQPLFAEERQEQIIELLNRSTKLLVPELCEYFQVSPATIRNDLRDLAATGRLKRTHGGAIPLEKTTFEPTFADKEISHLEDKVRIALLAAELVEDGDTVAIDAGTTMLELAKQLFGKQNLTIVTNDIRVASCFEANSPHVVIMLGGILRRGLQCTVGPLTLATLQTLNVDKAFLATNAFHPQKGFTTPDINQAEVKKAFMHSAGEVIVLCDSSKFGKISFTEFAQLRDIDKLITDSRLNQQMRSYLEDHADTIDITYA